MILRSIRAEGWRCFAAPVEVGPFIDGLNIIHGPNGIGKSTLMMALARGLFDSHNVGGSDIRLLQPWGRSLAPKVSIEFEQHGTQLRLYKQFLSSQAARLDRWEGDRYVPFAEGRAADDQARELLAAEAPGRGASDLRHWGLAQILWAPQGSLQIEQLASSTRATIQDSLGAQIAGPGTESLESRIAEIYAQFFTAKGKLKSGASAPAILGLEARMNEAREARHTLQQRLIEFDEASRLISDLRTQTQTAAADEEELDNKLKVARQQAQAFSELVNRKKLHTQELQAATESYRGLSERLQAIEDSQSEVRRLVHTLERLREDFPPLNKLVSQAEQEAKVAQQNLQELRGRRNQVSEARQLGQQASRYCHCRRSQAELEKRIQSIESAERELSELRKSREQIIAPDKKALAKIKTAIRQRDDLRLRLDSALITLSIQPESDTQIEIFSGEPAGPLNASKDEQTEIRGTPEVSFRIPGIGRFFASGPTGDFAVLQQRLETAQEELKQLTAGFGHPSLEELELQRTTADAFEQQIAQAKLKLETLLAGERLERLREQFSLATATAEGILQAQPQWRTRAPDPEQLTRTAEESESQFTRYLARAEETHDRAQDDLRRRKEKQSNLQAEIRNQEAQSAAAERRLNTLRKGAEQDELRNELERLALLRGKAQGNLKAVEREVQQAGDNPSKIVAVLEGQLEAIRSRTADAERRLHIEMGRLEQIIAEAPYSALAEIEDEISHLEGEIVRQQLHIDSIRLLHDTLAEQKQAVVLCILEPIRKRAKLILQRIAGTRFEDVHFDESLLPSGISPASVGNSVSLDTISGGEREQVHFAVRMALAHVAFQEHRQLVVLDDVFTFTDTSRLARIATILEETSQRFQIVLLTCHPERYRGLSNAKFFDLQQILNV